MLRRLSLTVWSYALIGIPGALAAGDGHHGVADVHDVSDETTHGASPEAAHDAAHGAAVDAAHATAEHASGGLPQFDPSSFVSQTFWLVIMFTILYVFFSRKTLPEISSVLENRQEHIQSDLDTAEELRTEAEKVHQAYEGALEEARMKATDYFVQADQKTKEKTHQEFQAFYERSNKEIDQAENRIEQAKSQALEEMNSIAAEIASEAAQKIVGISTDIDQAKNVVQAIHKKKAA